MPELPDVKVFEQHASARSLDRNVAHVHVRDQTLLRGVTRQKLASQLVGSSFDETQRHGKFLALKSNGNGALIFHFGMTGELRSFDSSSDEPEHAAVIIEFNGDGYLAYLSKRRLGQGRWAACFDDFAEDENLGPDALAVDLDGFRDVLDDRRGSIKSLLMNQSALAGIGSVYSDEILFHAGVRPDRDVASLGNSDRRDLHRPLRHVLTTAIDRGAQPDRMPESWLLPSRQEGASCPRCEGRLTSATIAGRTSYFCESCQT